MHGNHQSSIDLERNLTWLLGLYTPNSTEVGVLRQVDDDQSDL